MKNGHLVFLNNKMIIEVAPNVLDKLLTGDSDIKKLLMNLSYSVLNGFHIVFLRGSVDFYRSKISKILGKDTISLLYHSNSKLNDFGCIKKIVSNYVLLSLDSTEQVDNKCIVINPLKFKSISFFQKTDILTENQLDCDFFEIMAKSYAKSNKISSISFEYKSIPGGGSTAGEVLQKEIDQNLFCVAIADSDKHNPYGNYGATYQSIHNVITINNDVNWVIDYVMDNVCEIENLIPRSLLEDKDIRTTSAKEVKKITKNDYSFYDIKLGVHIKKCDIGNLNCEYTIEDYNYWANMFPDNIVNEEIKLDCNWGRSVLDKVIKNKKDKLFDIKVNSLLGSQRKEWIEIGKIFYSWTCSFPKYNF